jgi:TetR/AcrR family transcriptional repressor of nem operon
VLSTHDEVIRKKIDRIFHAMEGYFEEALRKAIGGGEVAAQDTRAGAQNLIAYLEGSNMLAKTRNNPELIKQHGHDVVRLLASKMLGTRKLGRRST